MEDLSRWKEKFESCVYAKKLLDKLEYLNTKVNNPIDHLEVKKGIYYARKYHGTQMRKSGDPYYSHPIEVAIMLAEFTAMEVPKLYNAVMIQAALLHDAIEDTELTEEIISKVFGQEVAQHVEGLTRVKLDGKITAAESFNLLVKQKRYDTALIKLFDRIHNLQTLGAKSPEKAREIIDETFDGFIILAEYLKLGNITEILKEICYKYLLVKKSKEKNLQKVLSNGSCFLSPVYQNEIYQIQIQYLSES